MTNRLRFKLTFIAFLNFFKKITIFLAKRMFTNKDNNICHKTKQLFIRKDDYSKSAYP